MLATLRSSAASRLLLLRRALHTCPALLDDAGSRKQQEAPMVFSRASEWPAAATARRLPHLCLVTGTHSPCLYSFTLEDLQ